MSWRVTELKSSQGTILFAPATVTILTFADLLRCNDSDWLVHFAKLVLNGRFP